MSTKASFEIPEQWQALFYRYCRLPILVWPLLLAMALIAWNRGLALLYGLCAIVIAALLLSLLPKFRLRTLSADIKPITPVHAGQPQTVTLVLRATQPIYGCTLALNTLEFSAAQISRPAIELTQTTTPRYRGQYVLTEVVAATAYPFGLIRWQQAIALDGAPQTVYPQLVDIHTLPSGWLSGSEQHAHFTARHKGAGDLLLGLRDYQTSDPFRHIDWRATARSQAIKVREFEQQEHPHLCLVINAHDSLAIGEKPANAFEHSLIIAASLARYALQAGLGLSAYLPNGHHFTIAAHHQLQQFFAALAGLEPSAEHTPAISPKSGSIIVSFQTDTVSADIAPSHSKHWRIIFDSESYLKPLSRKKVGAATVAGHEVIIPIGAQTPLAEVFNRG